MSEEITIDKKYPLREAVEVNIRDGLPNFFHKLAQKKSVQIGYFGGSITEQNGWRFLSHKWFQKCFPNTKITQLHAAIGGTGSEIGVFRMEWDLLKKGKKPDVIFVEFAVNDFNAPTRDIVRAMEGIIRKIWKKFPECDICFVYTITQKTLKFLQEGKCTRPMSIMENIADHYGIPSVNMGIEIAQLEKDDKLVMSSGHMTCVSGKELNKVADIKTDNGKIVFSCDGAHPYLDTGHALYMMALKRGMEKIKPKETPALHKLPKPLDSHNWENGKMLPLSQGAIVSGGEKIDFAKPEVGGNFLHRIPELWKLRPDDSLTFKFNGTKAMVYDVIGPGCGMVEVKVDGKTKKVARFDKYSAFFRLGALSVADNLKPGIHTVEIRPLTDKIDKKAILENSLDIKKNPLKYSGENWYCSAIFLVGDIVK